ncbi:MerR family transcriptional regulator [Ruminococcus sp. 5_1_39BFAA]|uniref:MerR family transcriptional regulator n=1 Tax=Ruminococcus sp. 5_1_39BFAA TaxID=457412 RepID=UPI003565929E
MRISEAAELTGLSVSNIRFYERKGLLTPERREESKYRDYSQDDIHNLKKIILYRKMGIPVETISLLQKDEVSLESVLREQEEELLRQQEMLKGSLGLCRKLRKEENAEKIDIDYYLEYVEEEEEKGNQFSVVDEMLECFAEYSRVADFIGDRYVGKYYARPRVFRIVNALCLVFYLLMPVIVVIDKYVTDRRITGVSAVFWGVWLLCLILCFRDFLAWKKRRDEEGKE